MLSLEMGGGNSVRPGVASSHERVKRVLSRFDSMCCVDSKRHGFARRRGVRGMNHTIFIGMVGLVLWKGPAQQLHSRQLAVHSPLASTVTASVLRASMTGSCANKLPRWSKYSFVVH